MAKNRRNILVSKRIAILFLALTACVGCDQSTKFAAKSYLQPGEVHSYLGDTVRVVLAENTGAFLGLGASLPSHVRTAIFVVLASCILFWLAFHTSRQPTVRRTELSAVGLIVGGGVGNLIDRMLNDGAVVDFLNVGIGSLRTGIFNVADMALMLGVGVYILSQRDSNSA